jgi:putative ABC transport system permease protein
MPHDLTSSLGSDVVVGIAQAAGAIALCLGVVALCRWFGVNVEREAASSMARGLVQMVIVGTILALLLNGSLLIGVLILFGMTIAAAVTASRRLPEINGTLPLSLCAMPPAQAWPSSECLPRGRSRFRSPCWCRWAA